MNRGRIQAQGNYLEESESWGEIGEITKNDGHDKITDLQERLTNQEMVDRNRAFQKLENFIDDAPQNGHYAQIIKSFSNSPQERSVRVDIEIRSGRAFID
jgi:hypothetical protein